MTFDNYKGRKYYQQTSCSVDDFLTTEQPLQININNTPFSVTMRTPGNDTELIRGLLFTEDIYRKDNQKITIEIDGNEANVTVDPRLIDEGYKNSRSILSNASCGICGKKELEELDAKEKITFKKIVSVSALHEMFAKMKKHQKTFHKSGGSHAAAAFKKNGELLAVMEDIGRHNATDKIVGSLILSGTLSEATCILVSGRISYEIVSKTFAAKVPILAAVSAPSTLAVDFSKELGITLLAFCRDGKATCYAHPQRISEALV